MWKPLIAMYLVYVGIRATTIILDVTFAPILDAFDANKKMVGMVLSIGTFGYLVGKLTTGGMADKFGGARMLKYTMVICLLLTFVMSWTTNVLQLSIVWSLFRYMSSAVWPSLSQLVIKNFDTSKHSMLFSILNTSPRSGNMLGGLLFGYLLDEGWDWRSIYRLGSIGLMVPILIYCLLFLHFKKSPTPLPLVEEEVERKEEASKPEESIQYNFPSTMRGYTYFLAQPSFQRLILAQLGLCAVIELHAFYPLMIKETLDISAGEAGQLSAMFQLGCVVSLLLVSQLYHRLRPSQQEFVILLCMACSSIIFFCWSMFIHTNERIVMVMMGLLGAFLAPPYCIPNAMYQSKMGGDFCSSLSGLVDAIAFIASMCCNILVGYVASNYGWENVLRLGVVGSAASTISMYFYYSSMSSNNNDKLNKPLSE